MKSEIDFDDDFILIDHKQNIDKVTDDVYIGSSRGALDKKYLDELKVKSIVVCGSDLRLFFPEKFNYKIISVKDDPDENILKYFEECLNFIDQELPVFVHCKRGVSRSATIMIAYIMWKLKIGFIDAYNYLKERRGVICPNSGFISQLKKFEIFMKENNWNLTKL